MSEAKALNKTKNNKKHSVPSTSTSKQKRVKMTNDEDEVKTVRMSNVSQKAKQRNLQKAAMELEKVCLMRLASYVYGSYYD